MVWDISPVLFKLGPLEIRYYGLFFAISFYIAITYAKTQFKEASFSDQESDSFLNFVIFGTLIGARLGHCLFYQPEYYLPRPFEILKVWEGGLASHGGFFGVFVAIFLYLKKWKRKSFFWLIETTMAPIMGVAGMIRLGNLMNSEIIGRVTDVPWAFKFVRVDNLWRHPAQLYESIGYFTIALLAYFVYRKYIKTQKWVLGRGFGLILATSFLFRLCIEFFKVEQVAFERGMTLNMGQILSIPFIIIGIYFFSGVHNKHPFWSFLAKPFALDKKTQKSKKKKKK